MTDPTRIDIEFDPRTERMVGIARHGYTPSDVPYVSMIVPDFWTGGCEDGLNLPKNIAHVVSLYPWERYRPHEFVRSALTVKMYDSLDQSMAQVHGIAAWVNACRADGPTLVQCQAGLNHSALVAATALVQDGMTPDAAIELLRAQRSPAVLCNPEFEAWVRRL